MSRFEDAFNARLSSQTDMDRPGSGAGRKPPRRSRLRSATLRLGLAGALLAGLAAPVAAAEAPYTLNPGDVLTISVWKEEGLEREVVVLPDGKIAFPLVGHVHAAGMTPEALQAAMAEKLSPFIPDPAITVSVKQTAGNFVYVVGQVRQPGAFPINGVVDVMQALSLAGGLTPFASDGRIVVLRRDGAQQRSIPFDYGEVEGGHALESNIELRPGDVVVVPE